MYLKDKNQIRLIVEVELLDPHAPTNVSIVTQDSGGLLRYDLTFPDVNGAELYFESLAYEGRPVHFLAPDARIVRTRL